MPRPVLFPVMWLPRLIAVSAPTAWRRAKKFHYGQLYRDDDGRLCVKLEVVEHVEGCVFTDAQLAGTAAPNPTKRESADRAKFSVCGRATQSSQVDANQLLPMPS